LREATQVAAPRVEPRSAGAAAILAAPPMEIDVRGQTVEEALEAIERRLDAAYLAGLPFLRVIHGKGTGRLRQAIRQSLRKSRYTASFESGSETEGGDGVTVIRLNAG
jgi:DNA mismatch repair protein MutS2